MYINNFIFPDHAQEQRILEKYKSISSYYTRNIYPFEVNKSRWTKLEFTPITILYGNNGSGKSTILNVIAERLKIKKRSAHNSSFWFSKYAMECAFEIGSDINTNEINIPLDPEAEIDLSPQAELITSDDVFSIMLDERIKNEKTIKKSMKIMDDQKFAANKTINKISPREINFETGENLEEFLKIHAMRNRSLCSYVTNSIGALQEGVSNGEKALQCIIDWITPNKLYLLDEPENSMSSEFQHKLAAFIRYCAMINNCQFIIATHSPFFVSIPGAKIYDINEYPSRVKSWWELENMQTLFSLFENDRANFLKYRDTVKKKQ